MNLFFSAEKNITSLVYRPVCCTNKFYVSVVIIFFTWNTAKEASEILQYDLCLQTDFCLGFRYHITFPEEEMYYCAWYKNYNTGRIWCIIWILRNWWPSDFVDTVKILVSQVSYNDWYIWGGLQKGCDTFKGIVQ